MSEREWVKSIEKKYTDRKCLDSILLIPRAMKYTVVQKVLQENLKTANLKYYHNNLQKRVLWYLNGNRLANY